MTARQELAATAGAYRTVPCDDSDCPCIESPCTEVVFFDRAKAGCGRCLDRRLWVGEDDVEACPDCAGETPRPRPGESRSRGGGHE